MSWFSSRATKEKEAKKEEAIEIKREENALLNAKNRQVQALKNMVNSQAEIIETHAKTLSKYAKAINETKIVDALIENAPTILSSFGIKVPEKKQDQQQIQQTVETGRLYTDEQIKEKLNLAKRLTPDNLNDAVAKGKEGFMAHVKSNVPDISDESAARAYEIAKVLV